MSLERRPRKGDTVCFPSGAKGEVVRMLATDPNICVFRMPNAGHENFFIWRFGDGTLNRECSIVADGPEEVIP